MLEPPEIVPLRLRVHMRIIARRVEREDQSRHVHMLEQGVEIHEGQIPQRGKERGEDRRAARPILRISAAALHRPADLRKRGDHGAARKYAQRFQLALAQRADALEAVKETLQPLLVQLSAPGAQQRAAKRKNQPVPARGTQLARPAQNGCGALRLALRKIEVVKYPLLRGRQFFPPRLLRLQRGMAALQLPQLRAQPFLLAPRRADPVHGEQPRRRRGIGVQSAEIDVQSGRNDVHTVPHKRKIWIMLILSAPFALIHSLRRLFDKKKALTARRASAIIPAL